jgi:DNA-binding PadR family transcriptional regulator
MRHDAGKDISLNLKPLSEAVALILMSLTSGPRHGYALLKDVERLSEGRVQLSTGTLYGAIHRLLTDEWIERFAQEDTSRDKQAYRLTARGRAQLNLELRRLRSLVRAAALIPNLKEL